MHPSIVFVLKGNSEDEIKKLNHENKNYNYSSNFFDIYFNVEEFFRLKKIEIVQIDSDDINSEIVKNTISNYKLDFIIFSGGGILNSDILSLQTPFVHIHPGKLPEFRGSTCFYYSILFNNSLYASAILMDAQIDTGCIVAELQFKLNYKINSDQPYFMDYILDSYIEFVL